MTSRRLDCLAAAILVLVLLAAAPPAAAQAAPGSLTVPGMEVGKAAARERVPAIHPGLETLLRRQLPDFVLLLGVDREGNVRVLRSSDGEGYVVGALPGDTPPGAIVKDEWERTVVTRVNPDCVWRKIGGTWVLISGSPSQCVLN